MITGDEYQLNHITIDKLNEELDSYWEQILQPNSLLREQALTAGLSVKELDSLAGKTREDVIIIQQEGSGLGLITTTVIIAFTPVIAEVVKGLWKEVFLPRVKKKFGPDSITAKEATSAK